MKHLGNFKKGQIITLKFNTHRVDGVPVSLLGSPVVSVYKNSTTQTTTGVSLNIDYDALVGLNLVTIDTSLDGTFYDVGDDFDIIITTGTVDSTNVAGYILGTFSIENRYINQVFAEPSQGAPPASASIVEKINYLYKAWRNKKTQTASQYSLFNDAGNVVDHKTSVSDDGTTTTINEIEGGP